MSYGDIPESKFCWGNVNALPIAARQTFRYFTDVYEVAETAGYGWLWRLYTRLIRRFSPRTDCVINRSHDLLYTANVLWRLILRNRGHIFEVPPLAANVSLWCVVLLSLLCLGSLWSFVLVSTCSFVLGLMLLRLLLLLLIVTRTILTEREFVQPMRVEAYIVELELKLSYVNQPSLHHSTVLAFLSAF